MLLQNQLTVQIRLHIKSRPPVSIEKLFSKTHAPVFGLMLDGNFWLLNLGSRTNTVQYKNKKPLKHCILM